MQPMSPGRRPKLAVSHDSSFRRPTLDVAPARAAIFPFVLAGFLLCAPSNVFAGNTLIADINGDALINSQDVDLLASLIGTLGPDGDLNLNGLVDLADFDLWFELYSIDSGVPVSIAVVDLNFDQVNDPADYAVIFANLSQSTTDFTRGNLNGDSIVSTADIDRYFSLGGVPEPASMILGVSGFLSLALYRPRRALPTADQ